MIHEKKPEAQNLVTLCPFNRDRFNVFQIGIRISSPGLYKAKTGSPKSVSGAMPGCRGEALVAKAVGSGVAPVRLMAKAVGGGVAPVRLMAKAVGSGCAPVGLAVGHPPVGGVHPAAAAAARLAELPEQRRGGKIMFMHT
jgi:hypothetical protein